MIYQLFIFCFLFSSSVFAFPFWNSTDCMENPTLKPCPIVQLEDNFITITNSSSNITWTPLLYTQTPVPKAPSVAYVTRIKYSPANEKTKLDDFMNNFLALIQKGLFNLDNGDLLLNGLDTLRKGNCSQGLNYYTCTLDSENVTVLNLAGKWEPLKLKIVIIAELNGESGWVYSIIDRPRWSEAPVKTANYIFLPPSAELNCTKWMAENPIDKLEKFNGTIRIPRCWLKNADQQ